MKHLFRYLSFILAIHYSAIAQNQVLSTNAKEAAESLSKTTFFSPYPQYPVGLNFDNPTWKLYTNFKNVSLENDLKILASNDTNDILKAYAFLALCDKKLNVFQILNENLRNYKKIMTFRGCLVGTENIGDIFIEQVIEKKLLSDLEIEGLNEKLLFDTSCQLERKMEMLKRIKPLQKYYQIARKNAIEKNDIYSIFTLSKFRNQEDKFLIEKLLSKKDTEVIGYMCVMNFPDENFKKFLLKFLDREIYEKTSFEEIKYRKLYKAVASYNDTFSVDFFKKSLKECPSEAYSIHAKYIWIATQRFPNKIYEDLEKKTAKKAKKETHNSTHEIEIE
jgi:hypothetical protein